MLRDKLNNSGGLGNSDSLGVKVIDPVRLFSEIVTNKFKIVFCTVLFFLAFSLYAYHMKPEYQSSVLIKVEPDSSSAMSALGSITSILGKLPLVGAGQANSALVEQTLIGSSYILGSVINKLGLDILAEPKTFPVIGKWIYGSFKGQGIAKPTLWMKKYAWGGQKVSVAYLKTNSEYINKKLTLIATGSENYELYGPSGKRLLVGQVGKLEKSGDYSSAITIKVDRLEASPGNQFILEKKDLDRSINNIKRKYTVEDLGSSGTRQHTGILKVTYTGRTPKAVISFLNTLANFAYTSGEKLQEERAEQTLAFLNKQLPLIKKSLKESESALSAYQAKTGNINIEDQYRFILSELSKRQAALESLKLDLTELEQKYTDSHPYIITLKNKIAEASVAIKKLENKLHTLPVTDKKAVQLLREVKTKNELFVMLMARQQELQVLKAGVRSNIKILNYASTPPLMIPPKKVLTSIIGLLIGFIVSCCFFIFRVIVSKKIETEEEFESAFNIDVKAIIPFSKEQKVVFEKMQSQLDSGKYILSEEKANNNLVESLLSLRTNIQIGMLENHGNVISICSLTPAAGKSFISVNLAFVLSQINNRVLLVDADLRRGYIHKYFGGEKTPGITDVALGESAFESVVVQYKDSNLFGLMRGKTVSRTADLLQLNRFGQLMEWAKKNFDYVVIDTPPVLLLTDSVLIAKHSDMNLMVLPSGRHQISEINKGLNLFHRNNVNINGAIINMADRKAQKLYGYYAGYSGYKNYEYYAARD